MLIIYSILPLGGIETFLVRLAKERYLQGLITRFLFIGERQRCDASLLAELYKHADVYFLEELTKLPHPLFRRLPIHFRLLTPLDTKKACALLDGIKQVHLPEAQFFLYFLRLRKITSSKAKASMGVYHSKQYTWNWGEKLPYFERINRQIFFQLLSSRNILFFNDRLPAEYSKLSNRNFQDSPQIPLGVIDQNNTQRKTNFHSGELQLVSVGRLVDFKTYNLWMIEVVRQLRQNNIDCHYHIYGSGNFKPQIEAKIQQENLQDFVHLHGNVPYAELPVTLLKYDVFIGSGTAIVEAASLGLPSIIGIESEPDSLTYGFLCDIPGFTYNEDGLYSKTSALDLLKNFHAYSATQKQALSDAHIEKSRIFSIQNCSKRFENIALDEIHLQGWRYNRLHYALSYFCFSLKHKLTGASMNKTIYG